MYVARLTAESMAAGGVPHGGWSACTPGGAPPPTIVAAAPPEEVLCCCASEPRRGQRRLHEVVLWGCLRGATMICGLANSAGDRSVVSRSTRSDEAGACHKLLRRLSARVVLHPDFEPDGASLTRANLQRHPRLLRNFRHALEVVAQHPQEGLVAVSEHPSRNRTLATGIARHHSHLALALGLPFALAAAFTPGASCRWPEGESLEPRTSGARRLQQRRRGSDCWPLRHSSPLTSSSRRSRPRSAKNTRPAVTCMGRIEGSTSWCHDHASGQDEAATCAACLCPTGLTRRRMLAWARQCPTPFRLLLSRRPSNRWFHQGSSPSRRRFAKSRQSIYTRCACSNAVFVQIQGEEPEGQDAPRALTHTASAWIMREKALPSCTGTLPVLWLIHKRSRGDVASLPGEVKQLRQGHKDV